MNLVHGNLHFLRSILILSPHLQLDLLNGTECVETITKWAWLTWYAVSSYHHKEEVLLQRKTKIGTTYRGLVLTVLGHAIQFILWGRITLVFSGTSQLNMQHRGTQTRFNPRVVYLGLVVYQVTMGQSLLQVLLFSPISIIPPMLHTFLSFTDIWFLQVL
jgi:hypothetical protein